MNQNEVNRSQVLQASSAKDVHSQNQVQHGMQMECTSSNSLERKNVRKIVNGQAAIFKNLKTVHKKNKIKLEEKIRKLEKEVCIRSKLNDKLPRLLTEDQIKVLSEMEQ